MKSRLELLVVIPLVILVAFSFQSTAFASLSFETNKNIYLVRESLDISGTIDNPEKDFIIIEITSPSQKQVAKESINIKENGEFSKSFFIGGEQWSDEGIYQITVTGDGETKRDTILVFNAETSSTIRLEPEVLLDKKSYSWAEKITIFVIAPDMNKDKDKKETIGDSEGNNVSISTSFGELTNYQLVETTEDSGMFSGVVTLTGSSGHVIMREGGGSVTGKGVNGGEGPDGGQLGAYPSDVVKVSYDFGDDIISTKSEIKFTRGKITWDESSYLPEKVATIRVSDPDLNLDPTKPDYVIILVGSETSQPYTKTLKIKERGNNSGKFEAEITFSSEEVYSTYKLWAESGSKVFARYIDMSLPPDSPSSSAEIEAVAVIEKTEAETDTNPTYDAVSEREKQLSLLEKEKPIIVPSWIKNTAKWWSENQISDSDFKDGIKYLINERIIKISTKTTNTEGPDEIPSWIRNTAKWWAQGEITNEDFVKGIEYLVENGIIQIK